MRGRRRETTRKKKESQRKKVKIDRAQNRNNPEKERVAKKKK